MILKGKQAENHIVKQAITKVVNRMLENNIPLVRAELVVAMVKVQEDVAVTAEQVKKVMKDELGLAYRMTRKIPVQANHKRCLVLR